MALPIIFGDIMRIPCEKNKEVKQTNRYDMKYTLQNGTTKQFPVESNSRIILYSFGASSHNVTGMWLINCASSGLFTISTVPTSTSSNISLNTDTANVLKIINGAAGNAILYAVILQGEITAPAS